MGPDRGTRHRGAESGKIGRRWDRPRDPRIASIVANALLYGQPERQFYKLLAWVAMPNHVHAIFQPNAAMPTIMRWLKGRTGRLTNRILGRSGIFWQDESFDHWIRSAPELRYFIEYVERNPTKAGLVESKGQWPWSSASGSGTDHRLRWSVTRHARQLQPADTRQKTIVCPTGHLPYCTGSVAASVVWPPTASETGTAEPVVALAGTVTAT